MELKDFDPFEKWIPKEDLVVGQEYFCKSRNFKFGIWNGTDFDYMRVKWGQEFPDTEQHWDDGAPYGTVKPFIIIERVTTGVLRDE